MSLNKLPMRYAHPEGHTDVCFISDEKSGLVTCGSDGDIRTWLSLIDDDPSTCCVAEQATTVISKEGKIYVGNDNNTVQIVSFPELEKEGILTRFSATISTLATTKRSKLIASGACDMRIHVTNIENMNTTQLIGHEAPILGLSLDPKEVFLASSSADGSIKVWNIKEVRCVNTWHNIVPKCNSFLTAKVYCVPSFNCTTGDFLAFPHGKDVEVVERLTWKEAFRLKCPDLKTELSICKFSECGTLLAASSFYGEVMVWDVESRTTIGYIEHQNNVKITSLCWHPEKPKEIAFCDAMGQLGCIKVKRVDKSSDDAFSAPINNKPALDNDLDYQDEEDDAENVISLNKIKSSVVLDPDQRSVSSFQAEKCVDEEKNFLTRVNLQEAFQPGSTPQHLLSRYMMWNDTGIVMCFNSEDGEESNIEVQFHDVSIHHSIHLTNYLHHTMAALSPQALALCCPPDEDAPSKLVVIVLQGWGSGNKEWSIDLPENEEAQSIAVGNTFVAVATNRRNLRLFMIGGTQREIIALPGAVVAMNGYNDHLVVAYHTGIGLSEDQRMNMLWVKIIRSNIRSKTIELPLSPSSKLSWLGLTDLSSPTIMDSEGIIRIYDKKSAMWRVACDTNRQSKGKMDHFFIIGVSESERLVRCILCKGSYYPPTNPRPIVHEISLIIPLCEPDTEKSEKEAKVWQFGSHPEEEKEAVLMLIALACRNNLEFRAVELCQQIATQKVIELAIKYAARNNNMTLANKLESIGEEKDQEKSDATENELNSFMHQEEIVGEEPILPAIVKSAQIEIKPISLSQTTRKSNPFLRTRDSSKVKGLAALNAEEPQKTKSVTKIQKHQQSEMKINKQKSSETKGSFLTWFNENRGKLEGEFPDKNIADLTRIGLSRFKEASQITTSKEGNEDTKKRKLSDSEKMEENGQSKRSSSSKLAAFAHD